MATEPPVKFSPLVEGHQEVLDSHYDAAASVKENAYCIGDSSEWQCNNVLDLLEIDSEHRVVDMGGGDGAFGAIVHSRKKLRQPIVCVDPSPKMIESAKRRPEVEALNEDCLAFTQRAEEKYDRILFKEVVHHFSSGELPAIFKNAYSQLSSGGILLIATRPKSVDYIPIFEKARIIWSNNQPPFELFVGHLQEAGFDPVDVDRRGFKMDVPKPDWLNWCRSRCWSCFAPLSQEDMDEGMADLEKRLEGVDVVEWTDTYIYIKARKP
eukprot:NODE_3040_length_1062_cov_26.399803_g2791_i0.p1 GENE.NODE_3040_length_1062_cov_26.399803_g2791_i0~~NODE_3040_length_1062_cov_26.399803_g2791_i0.p1  ORF type:complete len:267 (-),score=59.67 NODE_3040_length_1062_cov_26.399803_g2791_i0:188-988(-)